MSSYRCLTAKHHHAIYITMNNTEINTSRTTVALAIVGFIALVGAFFSLAVYSTRFVPGVVGSAAVYLGSVFSPAPEPSLSVVPAVIASTTIPFPEIATTTPATSTAPKPVVTTAKPATPTPGPTASSTYLINGTAAQVPSGLPDFIVVIKNVGYLATSSADSFVASSSVPSGSRPAVSFSIKNVGTNVAGSWRFSASIPTQTSYIFQSQPQQALAPGDSIDYVLGFDQANKGSGQMISVTANFDHAVTESNSNNNSASTNITILGN